MTYGRDLVRLAKANIVDEVFSPAAEQVRMAQEVAAASDRSIGEGAGAVGHNGMLVDLAHAKLAETLPGRRRAIGGRRA